MTNGVGVDSLQHQRVGCVINTQKIILNCVDSIFPRSPWLSTTQQTTFIATESALPGVYSCIVQLNNH